MKTDKIVLCPGKIPIRSVNQPWYMPITHDIQSLTNPNVMCENCYKIFGGMVDPICFKIVYGEKYTCACTLRSFDKSSITLNNIRVSIMNPDNFFRYRISKFRDEVTFHIPKDEKYIIIVENLDSNNNTKISVDQGEHNGCESRYYDKKYPYYLVLDDSDDYLLYNNSCATEQIVQFNVKKWEKINEPDMKKYYKLSNYESFFEFKINRNPSEGKVMNNILDINKNLKDRSDKIILIENFV
jgi:hypothetical protein